MATITLTNAASNDWPSIKRNLSAICLLGISACAVSEQFVHADWVTGTIAVALLIFSVLQWPGISLTYRFFAILAFGMTVGFWWSGKITGQTVIDGINRAAFFTFFLTSLAVLREAAQTSSLVQKCGRVLVHQPPARRYLLMTFGSHLFGIMLNIGALNVLGSMVNRATRETSDPDANRIAQIRRKRMLTATLRGFCGVPLWAPTSVTMLIVLSAIPQLEWEQYALFGVTWTLIFLLVGCLLDWLSYPTPAPSTPGNGQLTQLIPLIGLVALIPTVAYALAQVINQPLFPTLLMCVPVIGLAWIWKQFRGRPTRVKAGLFVRRLTRSFPKTFTNQRNELVLFASSGIIGVILIPLVDPIAVSNLITEANISDATLMVSISLSVLICAFVGINAIITATVMLGALQQLPDITIAPEIQASVIAVTWAVFAGASPFTASLRFISGFSGVRPLHFGVVWNGWFSASVLAIMYATLYLVL